MITDPPTHPDHRAVIGERRDIQTSFTAPIDTDPPNKLFYL